MTRPIVTVYIPTHNRAALLGRAIASVLRQDYSPIEIIVALDRSPAEVRSAVTAAALGARSGRSIRMVDAPAPGACSARNAAIAAASGELITGLDDDDYVEPGHVAALVEGFDFGRHSFAFTGYRKLYVDEAARSRESLVSAPLGAPVTLATLLRSNVVGNQVITLTRRMRQIGGFDATLPAWQDYDVWLRLVRLYGDAIGLPGHSYVFDQRSAADRISRDLAAIDLAYRLFPEKHAEFASHPYPSFLRLTRASYGGRILRLGDVARIASTAGLSGLTAEAVQKYWLGFRSPGCRA
jgi:glycosyltransferase involved in cell wall biosynthesis